MGKGTGAGKGKGFGGSDGGGGGGVCKLLFIPLLILDMSAVFGAIKIALSLKTNNPGCEGKAVGTYDGEWNLIEESVGHGSWRSRRLQFFGDDDQLHQRDDKDSSFGCDDDNLFGCDAAGNTGDECDAGGGSAYCYWCTNHLTPPPGKSLATATTVFAVLFCLMFLCALGSCLMNCEDEEERSSVLKMWTIAKFGLWTIPMSVISTILVLKYGLFVEAEDFLYPERYEDSQKFLFFFAFVGSVGNVGLGILALTCVLCCCRD